MLKMRFAYVKSNVLLVNAITVGSMHASPGQNQMLNEASCNPTNIFDSLAHIVEST